MLVYRSIPLCWNQDSCTDMSLLVSKCCSDNEGEFERGARKTELLRVHILNRFSH